MKQNTNLLNFFKIKWRIITMNATDYIELVFLN